MKNLWLLILLPFILRAQSGSLSAKISTLSVKQLNEDFTLFRNALEEAHPGLYNYTPKDTMDVYFTHASALLNDEMNLLDFYRVVCPIVSRIGCEHTGVELPSQFWLGIKGFTKYIPINLAVSDQKAYVSHNYTLDSSLRIGAQVLSINGTPVSGIINKMNAALTADGYPRSKEKLISNDFPFNYLLWIGTPDTFLIQLRTGDQERCFKTPALTLSDMRSNMAAKKKTGSATSYTFGALSSLLMPDSGFAYLSIHSFGERDLKLSKQHFKPFIDRFFQDIIQKNIPNLIIDLRANPGGEDEYSQHLFTWLADKPFHIDRSLPIKITGKPSFWKHTNKPFIVNMARVYISKTDSGLYVTRKKYFKNFKPASNGYRGRVYVLVNGQTGSAASQFCALVQSEGKGTIIGQETRGAYMGGNSGDGLVLTLPHSRFNIYIPFVKVNLNVKPREKGRGVIPDVLIERNQDSFFSGRDVMAEAVFKLIRNSKNK